MFNERYTFDYNPKTFMWNINIQEDKATLDAKRGSGESWFFPVAVMKAMGEYYGIKKYFNTSR